MKISQDGINLIKQFEGCELEAYPDPGTGGDPWTIGYGHTGSLVKQGMRISAEEAEELLRADLAKFEQCVDAALEAEITQHQFDALVCFAYNVGCRAMRNSTLIRLVNAGNIVAAQQQFRRWSKAGGKEMAGLLRRRDAEAELFGLA